MPPPSRIESNPAPAAAEAPAAPAAAPASGGFKAWLPLCVMVALMPVLAYAMTSFVLLPRLQKGLGAGTAAPAETAGVKTAPGTKKESVVLDKLLVNVAGTMGSRYLLVSLSLQGTDPDFKNKIADVLPQLKDMACGALATKTLADIEKPQARNLIRSELLAGFNNILGGPVVQEIYLTEFAIQ